MKEKAVIVAEVEVSFSGRDRSGGWAGRRSAAANLDGVPSLLDNLQVVRLIEEVKATLAKSETVTEIRVTLTEVVKP